MILDEDPAELCRATIGNFNIGPDKQALTRVRESLSSVAEMRQLRIAEAADALKKLSRSEATLRSQHSESVSAHSATSHANAILSLDTQKFRIAKAASDLEADGERLAAELDALKARLVDLEVQGLEGDEVARERREAEDPSVLRLKVFHSLGVEMEEDQRSGLKKAVIRSRKDGEDGVGDVHVVTVNPGTARSYYANYFWDAL